MRVDVAVIGAGLGGLAAALRLQAAGYRTAVFEARDAPGGRAYRLTDRGHTWDMGPTLVTLPSLFRELWNTAGADFDADVELLALRPFYRVIFADGSAVEYGGAADEEAVAALSPRDAGSVRRFLGTTERIYARAFEELARQPFLSLRDFLRVIPELVRLGAHRSVYSLARRTFRDERVRALFSFHPLFIGGNPLRASSVYSIVPHLERTEGVWYPRGGTYAIVEALARRYRELGGELRTSAPVAKLLVRGGTVRGIELESGESVDARAVVSNADAPMTYLRLLPPEHRPLLWRWRLPRMRMSMSCFLLYLGLDREFPDLAHHTVVMPPDYQGALREVFDGHGLPEQLAFYVHTPSRTDRTVAPPGCETMYVLVPVPHEGRGIDWAHQGDAFRDRVLAELESVPGFAGLREAVRVEHRFTPADFATTLRSYRGAAFSIEPTLFQSASFRPRNRTEIPGLYLVGAGTHPGAGMPGVLLSAEITSRLVARDIQPSRTHVAAVPGASEPVATGGTP